MNPPKTRRSHRKAAAGVKGVRSNRRSVLVVGENPEDRLFLQAAAQRVRPKLRFVFQGSAKAALAYLEEVERNGLAPSLVVLEQRLQSRSGLEFLRRARSRPGLAGLKALVWTEGKEPRAAAAWRRAGVEGFLKRTEAFEGWLGNVRVIAAAAQGSLKGKRRPGS